MVYRAWPPLYHLRLASVTPRGRALSQKLVDVFLYFAADYKVLGAANRSSLRSRHHGRLLNIVLHSGCHGHSQINKIHFIIGDKSNFVAPNSRYILFINPFNPEFTVVIFINYKP